MKTSFWKRLIAFILDAVIFSFIFGIFTMIIPESNNVAVLNSQLSNLSENILSNKITMMEYFNQYSGIIHGLDKELFLNNLFNLILMIGYFAILPFYFNGQTFGKKIMKIKIIKDDAELTMNDLIIRNIIINGFLFSLIGFAIIFLVNAWTYFIIISILCFIELLLVIISVFMILYRQDKKGLHDLWCKTSVIEEN